MKRIDDLMKTGGNVVTFQDGGGKSTLQAILE